MKTTLTKEQSARLIELGVPKEKASIKNIDEIVCTGYGVNDEKYIWSYRFAITDILEILPKEILNASLDIEWHKVPQKWKVGYMWMSETIIFQEELIDALYKLCVWCLEQGYLKFWTDDNSED